MSVRSPDFIIMPGMFIENIGYSFISGRAGGGATTLFEHPCLRAPREAQGSFAATCARRREGETWFETEARLVVELGVSDEPERIEAQVARVLERTDGRYVDGAVVAVDLRRPEAAALLCAWRGEFDRADSSDRDQFAFAAVSPGHSFAVLAHGDAARPCRGAFGRCEELGVLRALPKLLPRRRKGQRPQHRPRCAPDWLDDPRHQVSARYRQRHRPPLEETPAGERWSDS